MFALAALSGLREHFCFMSELPSSSEAPWRIGLRSARANLLPGLVLQVVALALVLAYYNHAPTRGWLDRLAEFRRETGYTYSFFATAIFGGVLPCLYLKLRSATRHRYDARQNTFLIFFWACRGLEVDIWYRILARVVGEGTDVATIATKLTLDQFVYCPIWAVPLTAVAYAWCETRFDTKAVVADLRAPRWYLRRSIPVLISNYGVWVPVVCIIYSLPTPLQIPLFNLVLCFFTLLLAHIAAGKHAAGRYAAK